jgi:hypothetical protein
MKSFTKFFSKFLPPSPHYSTTIFNTSPLVGEAVHLDFSGEDALAVGEHVVHREENRLAAAPSTETSVLQVRAFAISFIIDPST